MEKNDSLILIINIFISTTIFIIAFLSHNWVNKSFFYFNLIYFFITTLKWAFLGHKEKSFSNFGMSFIGILIITAIIFIHGNVFGFGIFGLDVFNLSFLITSWWIDFLVSLGILLSPMKEKFSLDMLSALSFFFFFLFYFITVFYIWLIGFIIKHLFLPFSNFTEGMVLYAISILGFSIYIIYAISHYKKGLKKK